MRGLLVIQTMLIIYFNLNMSMNLLLFDVAK